MEKNSYKEKIKYKRSAVKSDFLNDLIESEALETLKENSISDNAININTKYVYSNDEIIGFGIYISNSSNENIEIARLPIEILNDGKVIKRLEREFNLKVEANSIVLEEIEIKKDEKLQEIDVNNLTIGLGNLIFMKTTECFNEKLEVLDGINKSVAKREMKKFIKKLPKIEKNKLAIDYYAMFIEQSALHIILFMRNSSEEEVKIRTLPIKIYNEKNLLIHSEILAYENGINIGGLSNKFFVFKLSCDIDILSEEKFDQYIVKVE